MNETDPLVLIDHVNGNTLDNRRCNLRRTTHRGNSENRSKQKNTSSKYHGVHKTKYEKYVATVRSGDFFYQKSHKSEEYAARDRDLQIIEHLPKSLFKMNFDWNDEEELLDWCEKLQ